MIIFLRYYLKMTCCKRRKKNEYQCIFHFNGLICNYYNELTKKRCANHIHANGSRLCIEHLYIDVLNIYI